MADTSAANMTLPNGAEVTVTHSTGFQNWKGVAWGLAVSAAPFVWQWFSAVDWTQYVSPNWAIVIVGLGGVLFRVLASGPAFSPLSVQMKDPAPQK